MPSLNSAVALLALSGMATAIPHPQDGCDGLNGELLEECLQDGLQGPTHIDASDEAINFGDTHPSDVFKKLLESCSTAGCSGDKKVTASTTVTLGDWKNTDPLEIVVSGEGMFKPNTDATRETMVELLTIVSNEATEIKQEKWFDMVEQKEITQHYLSRQIHINTNNNGEDAFLNVYVEVGPVSSGFCSKMMAAASAIGYAIGSGPGGAFALAGLLCQ